MKQNGQSFGRNKCGTLTNTCILQSVVHVMFCIKNMFLFCVSVFCSFAKAGFDIRMNRERACQSLPKASEELVPIFERTKVGAGLLYDNDRHVPIRPGYHGYCAVRGGRYSSQPGRHHMFNWKLLLVQQAARLLCYFWLFVHSGSGFRQLLE